VPGAQTWSVFGAATSDKLDSRYAKGECKAFRLYSRALGENELAQNLKVDDIRFRGEVVTNVVVASETYQGAETNGVYEVCGNWTFSASGNGALAVYNTIEPVSGAAGGGGSLNFTNEYTHMQSDAPVRLTWRWRDESDISVSGSVNADGSGSLSVSGTLPGEAPRDGTNITICANSLVAGMSQASVAVDCRNLRWESGRKVGFGRICIGEEGALVLNVLPTGFCIVVR